MKITGVEIAWVEAKSINPPSFMHENDQRKNIDRLGDFDNKTPTHMATTHAISKSKRDFQNRIPRELDKNFDISGISVIH